MLRILELFGGIGACSKALERLGIDYEIADYVEIDKYAVKSFNAIHGTNFEPQDITEWDKDIDVDLIMHGSPCQDFSVAGRGAGGDEGSGTRSSLMYEAIRIVEKLKPKYVIWENVKNLLSKKHRHNFDAYQETMENLGYTSYYQVLNAKDYGIPQNRERVFTVSIREDIAKKRYLRSATAMAIFEFPEPMPLEKKLKDMLEDEVDEKYYLNDKLLKTYQRNFGSKGKETYSNECKLLGRVEGINGHDCLKRVYSAEGVSPTVSTCQGGNTEPKIIASRGRGPNNEQQLEPRKDGLTNTITSVQKDNYLEKDYRIRKLTPKECWRLMGFDDSDFEKAQQVNSNTQLYKQAGNSIVVNVLEAILKELCKEAEAYV